MQLGDGVGEAGGDHARCHHAGQPVALGVGEGVGAGFGGSVGAGAGATAAARMAAFFAACVAACVAVFDVWGAGALEAGSADCVVGEGVGGTGHAVDTKTEPLATLLAGSVDEPLASVRPRAVSEATPTTVAPAFAPMAQAVALNRTAIFRPPGCPRRKNAPFAH